MIGTYDGVETWEMVKVFLLQKLTNLFSIYDIDLYNDDSLMIIQNDHLN